MMHIRDILVATDFSDCSENAVRIAFRIGAATGARLHLVYVRVDPVDPFASTTYPADHRSRVVRALEDLFAQVSGTTDVPARRAPDVAIEVLDDRAVAPAIVRYARSHDVDFAVAGTHGRRGLRHLMLGSVAEELVRSIDCPVVTVRADADFAVDPSREVLVPVDFSAHSTDAVRVGREIAALFGCPLRVVHVIEETLHPAFYNAGAFSIYDLQPDVEEHAWNHIHELLVQTPGPMVPTDVEIVTGRAAAEIVRTADERHAWMVVMTTHGLTGLEHLMMGSVTERVVRAAPCPVCVVKSFGRSLFEGVGRAEALLETKE